MEMSQKEAGSSSSGIEAGASLQNTGNVWPSLLLNSLPLPPTPVVWLTTKPESSLLSNSFDWLLPVQRIQLKPILVAEH